MGFDNILFYLGLGMAALAVLTAIVYLIVYKAGMKRLMIRLEEEYGKRERKPVSARGGISAPKNKI